MTQRNQLVQGLALGVFLAVLVFVVVQVRQGFVSNNIVVDWGSLGRTANYDSVTEPYYMKLLGGIWFTLRLSLLSIVFALLLGIVVGVARLSSNPVIKAASSFYVELFRNTPLLIQIFFWYYGVLNAIPRALREGIAGGLGSVFGTDALIGEAVLAAFAALSIYTSAYIAETVRAGIQSIPRGQFEAAQSVGLSGTQVLTLVILPQALRVVIPPLGNQFLNLTKNSSLIFTLGAPDLFLFGTQLQNYEAQGFVGIAVVTLSYLLLSLSITAVLNLVNRRLSLPTR